jgi:hypothetical protein
MSDLATPEPGPSFLRQRLWDQEAYALAVLGVIYVLTGFFMPWWGLVFPGVLAGFVTSLHKPVLIRVALVAALSWILVGLVRDTMTGWHLSPRLGGLLGLHFGIAAYVILALISGAVGFTSAGFGRSLRREWQNHLDRRSL